MVPETTPAGYLTSQGREVLITVLEWQTGRGYSPTVRELTDAMGLASPSTVHAHLTKLHDQGYVTWVDGQVRTLVVTAAGREKVL